MSIQDTYSVASGQAIYGGMTAPTGGGGSLPAFIPAAGQLKSIHLNDLTSVNPCPGNTCWYSEASGQNGPWATWNGAVFSPDYSQYGAMIYWGGGHGGYDGTEFYIFDLTTQQWLRLNDPVSTDFLANIDATWTDYNTANGPVVPASHTYSLPVYIPPAFGGGVKGSWCLPYNVYGGHNSYAPHAVDLATGTWSRLTVDTLNPSIPSPYGGCFVDKRGMIWGLAGPDSNQHVKIDLSQSTKHVTLVTSFYSPGYYFCPCYVASKDMMVAVWCNYGQTTLQVAAYDLSSGTPVGFNVTLGSSEPVAGPGSGIDYCPDTGKFYVYDANGLTTIHVLTPPTDWKNGTWTWSTETMGGEAPVNVNSVLPGGTGWNTFSKWKYNPALKCFMWSQGTVSRPSPDGVTRSGAFQLYRPLGT